MTAPLIYCGHEECDMEPCSMPDARRDQPMNALRAYGQLLDMDMELPTGRPGPAGNEVVTMFEISTEEMHALARLAEREGDRALDRDEPEAAVALQNLVHRLLRAEERGLAELVI